MNKIDIAILKDISGIGNVSVIKIVDFCNQKGIKNLYDLKNYSLIVTTNITEKIQTIFTNLDFLYQKKIEEFNDYEINGIETISINDKEYPKLLKESTNPPVILYYKGDINLLQKDLVAVIGTRNNTKIGETITKKTIQFLVKNNLVIVSGLAKGIDTIAHKSCLENGGQTIAVLPMIDNVYPKQNQNLVDEILDNGGLILSENKPNTRFTGALLVKRDRIQSGLSKAVFVIESSINGGSLYASNDCIKLKRKLYAPNVYKLPLNYQILEQVQGVKNLIDTRQAFAYDFESYEMIKNQLKDIQKTLF